MIKRILAALLAFIAMSVFAAVDANTASQAELDGVKGIGPAIAGHIVEARKGGAFKDWPDFIERVKGVGEHNAVKFSEAGLTVNGAAFKGAPAKAAAGKPAAAPAPAPAAAPAAKAAPATAAPAAKSEPAKADAKADAKAAKEAAKKERAEKAEAAKKEKAEKAEAAKKEKAEKAKAKKKEKEAKAAEKAASAAKK